MESAGTFNCERFDCPQEKNKDCSLCERPYISRDIFAYLSLYKRCKQFESLPYDGGIFDQSETVMELLDIIDNELEKFRALRLEEQQGELMKQKMVKGLSHG